MTYCSLSLNQKGVFKLSEFLVKQSRHFKTSTLYSAIEEAASHATGSEATSQTTTSTVLHPSDLPINEPTEDPQYHNIIKYTPSPSFSSPTFHQASDTTTKAWDADKIGKNISQENDPSNYTQDKVDPRTVNHVFYFDSLALTKKLESKGFSREQAEGCVECLVEVIGNTLGHQAKHMITKSDQIIAGQQMHTEILSVKKDMALLQKSEFSALRIETEKISIDIARIQSHFQDEIVKLKGQFTLDINLERGRAVEAHAANEKNLQLLDNKIETEIAHLKTTYEVYRNDIFKYAAGTVLTCTTLIIGFIRLLK